MHVGYVLRGPDNDTHMYSGEFKPPRCPGCGFVLDHTWIDPFCRLRAGRTPDVSFTYDCCLIVSDNFRSAAKRFNGASYAPLPSQPGWFLLSARREVAFDSERRRTTFERFCDACGRWTQVIGARPVFLADPHVPLPDEFMRTDIEFGSGDALHPLIIVGPGLADALGHARLRGLGLAPIDHPPPDRSAQAALRTAVLARLVRGS